MSNAISSLFGRKPRNVAQPVIQPTPVNQAPADLRSDEILRKYAKLQRATNLSRLTELNLGRKQLGAGVV